MSDIPIGYDFMATLKKNKYNAKQTVVDGITFDSKKEAKRYGELKLLEKAGEISQLGIQPSIKLHAPKCRAKEEGDEEVIGKYIPDFSYFNYDKGVMIYEDVKAWDKKAKKGKGDWLVTPMSKWKIRHTEAEYGIKITFV